MQDNLQQETQIFNRSDFTKRIDHGLRTDETHPRKINHQTEDDLRQCHFKSQRLTNIYKPTEATWRTVRQIQLEKTPKKRRVESTLLIRVLSINSPKNPDGLQVEDVVSKRQWIANLIV